MLFSADQLPPIHALIFETRWEQNRSSLRVSCLAHLLRNDVLSIVCHVYGQDVLVVSVFPSFPAHNLPFILCFFPSFLFIFAQFFFVAFFCFGVLLLPNSSLFPLHFLVTFLCILLCFRSFMVDYSLVWLDCPLVSFFFFLLDCVAQWRLQEFFPGCFQWRLQEFFSNVLLFSCFINLLVFYKL